MTARAAELRLRSFIKLTRIALPFADTTAVVVSLFFFFGLEREKKGDWCRPGKLYEARNCRHARPKKRPRQLGPGKENLFYVSSLGCDRWGAHSNTAAAAAAPCARDYDDGGKFTTTAYPFKPFGWPALLFPFRRTGRERACKGARFDCNKQPVRAPGGL